MKKPSKDTISRLALYLRTLQELSKTRTTTTISSQDLARELTISSDQLRRDLWYFGQFGRRGVGYSIDSLKNKLSQILGLNKSWNVCVCGAGNLGSALLTYKGFKEQNLTIVACFDVDPKKFDKKKGGVTIYPLEDMKKIVKSLTIEIAIIATPVNAAQAVMEQLTQCGIKAILNFAPITLAAPAAVKLRNVDLSTELFNLTYFLSQA
ncbi:MAG: redox-sensing transcriptional repressor Rex [Omnitrophica WOR_2 bacterium GWF2_43_52]|nr:MAG: redox-sensing transcriptional repressor Rex [Omnitrophica WOR_2 bacterium GWA2_44_7]OGX15801.1 MAG: redox-sensing transcriptional repressor Rex [Omnitrophica WOR_2 bacterium GWC2_44_8]OGX21595.1 MAG: redox-sensing transcriptional repressor Rex [Omnitrophica WOR_2 bacterium GWF2_43_52]OGX59124.1 MAG: redox-sensing transcriptional repressor Rex [Omnitrophica WOR_2 bacterium RIFOXYC2_FULL_43_9]HAH19482.1 redox-sensing transcriptional repressor Rex [Candidatus Omnitrophota bacterium]